MMSTLFTTLVSATELQAFRGPLLLVDCRFDLADTAAGEAAYAAGHIPGAHYLHLDRDLSAAKTGRNGRHPLPDREAFAARMAALGLTPDTQVVAYDAQGSMYAARLWWMLRWLGHERVAVLDGGLAAWPGQLTNDVTARPAPSGFAAGESLVGSVDADQLQASLGKLRVIDARAPERFRGEVEPLDPKAGHIPGASNRLFRNNMAADGLRFKPAAALRAEFQALLAPFDGDQVVHQCGSGVTACHNLLAMEHAGLKGSLLYPGSWSEWSSDPARPVAIG
ncbi:sulfurtransferase [Pelomonas sp. KK5]|uniref:sulfurtransferase n=1 Tax=Pelomonas sp. KK5 TaxID=1855730 RepID=UPI00097C6C55|nr:sulfurtransferase [Pelomonas sp. KK5]